MSVSLNNHESRIKALENKIGSGGGIISSSITDPGYIKFANGLIINFGTSNGLNAVFKMPFTNKVLACSNVNSTNYETKLHPRLSSLTTTGMTITPDNSAWKYSFKYIAIGY